MKKNRPLGLLIMSLAVFLTGIGQSGNLQESAPTIVLDPGHGWKVGDQIDTGAISGDLIEKDINLDVAKHAQGYLERCPVDVHLTRDGDDPNHVKEDIDEIVNSFEPTVGISIHTNSGDGSPSGTEAWYTVGGVDDIESQRLAALLADGISTRLEIANRGIKPETENRHEGLYIHWWSAPSALVEIAFLQGDAELLRERRVDFGRSIAHSALQYLEIDPRCADWAAQEGLDVATYFPGDSRSNSVELRNDGLLSWDPLSYFLTSAGNEYGADVQYPLFGETTVDELAAWEIPAVAPTRPGVYQQHWQLMRGSESVGRKATVYIIVVPEEARELKQSIDQRIEELRQQGEQQLQEFLADLEEEAIEWVVEELTSLDCLNAPLAAGIILGAAFVIVRKQE